MEFETYQNLVFVGGFLIVFLLVALIGEFMWGHKWHKEIKAWADGKEIEYQFHKGGDWIPTQCPIWDDSRYEYRIKQQPKEPKYLYVYMTDNGIEFGTVGMAIKVNSFKDRFECIGKIKLEE